MKWSEVSQEDKGYPTTEVLATYTLTLHGPRAKWDHGDAAPIGFAAYVQETEENLTDLLPAGYEVRIREWDAEEEKPA